MIHSYNRLDEDVRKVLLLGDCNAKVGMSVEMDDVIWMELGRER